MRVSCCGSCDVRNALLCYVLAKDGMMPDSVSEISAEEMKKYAAEFAEYAQKWAFCFFTKDDPSYKVGRSCSITQQRIFLARCGPRYLKYRARYGIIDLSFHVTRITNKNGRNMYMDKKKGFFAALLEKLKKPADAVRTKLRPYAAFLSAGRGGGIILMLLLSAQFDIVASMFDLAFPKPVTMLVSTVIVVLVAEILRLLVLLLFGGGKRPRAYFTTVWLLMCTCNFIGTGFTHLLSSMLMSLVLVLAVDILGRCIVGFLRQRKFRQIFGYAAGGISLVLVILYGLYFRTDNFGESRIDYYRSIAPETSDAGVPGFDSYLEDGPSEVVELSYGDADDADIRTETIDISELATNEDRGFFDKITEIGSDMDLEHAPIKGEIYLPKDKTNCPTLVIVHGAHEADVPSYLGYAYLGTYLASNGYVVVSVDENICNDLGVQNDSRAIILLENIKALLAENSDASSPLYGMIDPHRLAIAGHSRGGEAVATAYLFNDLDAYPEDGDVRFDYHFDISAVIAIAPTVDQYMPASHAVKISDVNYLLLHGANDQDVSEVMGEKQYHNVTFTGDGDRMLRKASVYILGANHGQFNTEWGRYDGIPAINGYLNTANFLTAEEQQRIAKAYFRTFLDASLGIDDTYSELLSDNTAYLHDLPQTVYLTNYRDPDHETICAFEDSVDLVSGDKAETGIDCEGMDRWTITPDIYGFGGEGENYVLDLKWEKESAPAAIFTFDADMTSGGLSFRIADRREDAAEDLTALSYTVELTDANGMTVSAESPVYLYPTLAVQLYKQDVLFGSFEYKHQMQSVRLTREMFGSDTGFDFGQIRRMKILFDGASAGEVIIDDIDICHSGSGPRSDGDR